MTYSNTSGLLGNFIVLVAVSKQYDEDDEGQDDDQEEGDNDSNHDDCGFFGLRFVAIKGQFLKILNHQF